jgi:F-type H+-transporting ATPase subunit b
MKLITTAGLLLLATAAAALGADETVGAIPTAKQGLWTGVTALIVFAIVAAFLGRFVWPIIVKALDERAAKIREEISAAELARQQAKDALAMYERNLADARVEAQRMLEKTRSQQQAFADELRAKADLELVQMKERARRDIEAAKRAALQEIYGVAAAQATFVAAKILEREITSTDQQRLVDESLRELQTIKG